MLRFLGRAYTDVIEAYGWDSVTILYENNDSMMRLKTVFDRTAELQTGFTSTPFSILTKELVKNENGYRDVRHSLSDYTYT